MSELIDFHWLVCLIDRYFGFTLRGKNDFKLEDFYAGTPESFEPHYGEGGRDGDGDVFKDANIQGKVYFFMFYFIKN